MKTLNDKLQLLQSKIENGDAIKIMIIGLGSVGLYLLDYLVSLGDSQLNIIVSGRNADKMEKDVNIIKTAATIRGCLQSKIEIADNCNLESIDSIAEVIKQYSPDFIVNSSRVYSGLKYGSISWHTIRAYGIWTPLSIRYAKNIMEAYTQAKSNAITINTSYSDAVIPWLKSAGKAYFDFGSGNLNHLIPRMKFYIAKKFNITDINEIDITIATSHFHDVVISKEGQTERQHILLDIKYEDKTLEIGQDEVFRACMISMPVDQKRNMMNASSNFNIIYSILEAMDNKKKIKIHSPGVGGEIGGYPYIIDASGDKVISYFDRTVFNMEEMREANRKSIYLDGINKIENGKLYYTTELLEKTHRAFGVSLPNGIPLEEADKVAQFIIEKIIMPNQKV